LNVTTWISSLTKQIALNFMSTIPKINVRVLSVVESIHRFMGVDSGDFNPIIAWNHEDLAANPLHVIVGVFTIPLLFVLRDPRSNPPRHYGLIVLSSLLVFLIVIAYNPYIVRLQLSFFVLWGPVLGALAYLVDLRKWTYVAATLLFLSCLPWLILNRSRPVTGYFPHTMVGESVFRESREAILFANWTQLRDSYVSVTDAVRSSNCRNVGLRIDSHDIEYPFWWLLEAPQSGIRIEAVDTPRHLDRYLGPDFKPCAIICTACGSKDRVYGLARQTQFNDRVVLYLNESFIPEEDG
jgi:hypothetical protein